MLIDRDHFHELFEAPEDRLSFNKAALRRGYFNYAFKADILNTYHVDIIRNQLTQNLQAKMSDIVDELNASFADEFDRFITDGIDTSCITNKQIINQLFCTK